MDYIFEILDNVTGRIRRAILVTSITFIVSGTTYLSYYFCCKIRSFTNRSLKKRIIKNRINKNTKVYKLRIINESLSFCLICWNNYEKDDIIRELPCRHIYHKKCIDKWFSMIKIRCPMCRQISLP